MLQICFLLCIQLSSVKRLIFAHWKLLLEFCHLYFVFVISSGMRKLVSSKVPCQAIETSIDFGAFDTQMKFLLHWAWFSTGTGFIIVRISFWRKQNLIVELVCRNQIPCLQIMSTQPLHYELQATRSTRCEHHPVLWYLTLLFLQVLQGSLLSVWISTFSITWGLINLFWSMWNNNNHKALKTDAYDIVEA